MAHEVVFRTPQLSSFDARAAAALALLLFWCPSNGLWPLKQHQWLRGANSRCVRDTFVHLATRVAFH
jgi:hypothetical protein